MIGFMLLIINSVRAALVQLMIMIAKRGIRKVCFRIFTMERSFCSESIVILLSISGNIVMYKRIG